MPTIKDSRPELILIRIKFSAILYLVIKSEYPLRSIIFKGMRKVEKSIINFTKTKK